MSAWAQTVRLNPSQHRVLVGLAERRELSEYAMLARIVDAGFAALLHGANTEVDTREIATEVGSISERLADVERVLDRTLFTACAGYAYARHAALATRKSDDVIATEAREAFERQRLLAMETEA